MKITLIADLAREIAVTNQFVEPGETVEVDDELGKSLCEQAEVWQPAKTTKKEG